MQLTRRKRKRILLALLPVLVFVWALLPALPCCHELGDGTTGGDVAAVVTTAEHAGHHGHAAADVVGFTVDHGTNHCDDASVASTDPPCTDIEKTSNDSRPIHFASTLAALTSMPPVLLINAARKPPLPDPPPPPRYRPLHLEKSVLLI